MKRLIFLKLIRIIPLLLLLSCGQNGGRQSLTIATAANMQFAMHALTSAFEDQTGLNCDVIVSSSGKLTAQIREGAPYDVFVAADMKYPEELFRSGFTLGSPKVYAYGKLVLWSMSSKTAPKIEQLTDPSIKHIAMANPNIAPYGRAAVEALNYYDLYEDLAEKLVFGESIAQTNQFIVSQSAEAGFTAMSVVLSSEMKDKGKWNLVDPASYSPIAQGAVVLRREGKTGRAAQRFYEFLFSDQAKRILMDFGYSANE